MKVKFLTFLLFLITIPKFYNFYQVEENEICETLIQKTKFQCDPRDSEGNRIKSFKCNILDFVGVNTTNLDCLPRYWGFSKVKVEACCPKKMIRGPEGPTGTDGSPGFNGSTGASGSDGTPGLPGNNSIINGVNGRDGPSFLQKFSSVLENDFSFSVLSSTQILLVGPFTTNSPGRYNDGNFDGFIYTVNETGRYIIDYSLETESPFFLDYVPTNEIFLLNLKINSGTVHYQVPVGSNRNSVADYLYLISKGTSSVGLQLQVGDQIHLDISTVNIGQTPVIITLAGGPKNFFSCRRIL